MALCKAEFILGWRLSVQATLMTSSTRQFKVYNKELKP